MRRGDTSASIIRPRSSRAVVALYWACGALFALLVTLGFFMYGPQVEADEGSYLLNAAAIAGKLAANPPNGYYSGYSLLLFPGFLFDAGPERAYHIALVINALLVASMPLALYRLTRQLWPDSGSDGTHVVAAVAATCYAPLLMLSQHTMSEAALAPSFAWLLACTTTALRTTRIPAALAAGVFAGFLFLVHARGATMVAPILFAATAYAIVHPRSRAAVAALWLAAIAVAMLHGPLETAAGRNYASSAGMLREMLSRIALPANWKWLPFNFIGSATEAVVTSMGVAVVAACAVGSEMRRAWTSSERLSLRTTILIASAAALLVAIGVTAAFFTPPERADQLAYGRYALPTLIPLLAVGLLRLMTQAATRKQDLFWAFLIGIIGIAVSAIAYRDLPQAAQGSWNFVNSINLYLFHNIAPRSMPWLSIALCFVVLLGVTSIMFLRSMRTGAALYAVLHLTLFAAAWSTVTLPGSRSYAQGRGLVDAARTFVMSGARSLCIRLDPGIDAWHRADISWRLFPNIVASPTNDCIDGLIAPLGRNHPIDRRLAAFERPSPLGNNIPIGLFLRLGADFADFADFARVVTPPPEAALVRMPIEDRVADVRIIDATSLHAAVGVPVDLHVRITNRGQHALPGPDASSALLPYPIGLGAQVKLGDRHFQYRSALPEAIAPGDTADAVIRIGPFDQAGRYTLSVGMVQDFVAWYEGAAQATIEVGARQP